MIKNIFANLIGRFWGTVSSFLFIPLYINYLGFESYSIISFTLVITGLMAMLDAGVTATLSREFARIDKTYNEKIRIFKTLESIYFLIASFCIIFVYTLAEVIAKKWLNIDSFSSEELTYLLKIISVDIGFQLLMRFYMGGLLGLEKQVKANVYQIGWGMLRNGGVVVAIVFVPTLEMFFVWQSVSSVIFAILVRFSLCKLLTKNYLYFKVKIEMVVLADIWRFAGGMFLISLVAGLNFQLDKLIISIYLPIEVLGYYTLSVSLAMGLVMLANPISTALLPRFTALYSVGKSDEASKLFHKVSLYVAILIFSFMSNMVFNAEELFWIWTGKIELAEQASKYLPVIAMSFSMLAIAMIPYTIAIANGYTKLNNILGLGSLFVTLPGYWFGTKIYGAVGAATVFCFVQTAITFIYLYFINKMFINKIKLSSFYFRRIFLPLFVTLSIAYGFSLTPEWIENDRFISLSRLGFSTVCTLIITMLVLVPMGTLKRLLN